MITKRPLSRFQLFNRTLITGLLVVALTSCADPVVVPPVGKDEAVFSCEQLHEALKEAHRAKKDARKDDRAKASYLLVIPGYVSWYRMDRAEKAAIHRIDGLERLMKEKSCEDIQP
ncbi:MAG: hypothetical protein K2Q12_01980 [Rickettsiales bacterium]|nr:hypothetical protein [Rickettsiales bacterium]